MEAGRVAVAVVAVAMERTHARTRTHAAPSPSQTLRHVTSRAHLALVEDVTPQQHGYAIRLRVAVADHLVEKAEKLLEEGDGDAELQPMLLLLELAAQPQRELEDSDLLARQSIEAISQSISQSTSQSANQSAKAGRLPTCSGGWVCPWWERWEATAVVCWREALLAQHRRHSTAGTKLPTPHCWHHGSHAHLHQGTDGRDVERRGGSALITARGARGVLLQHVRVEEPGRRRGEEGVVLRQHLARVVRIGAEREALKVLDHRGREGVERARGERRGELRATRVRAHAGA